MLALSLRDPHGAGYASTAATGLRDRLLAGTPGDSAVIHSRVLGNVLYLMAALNTPAATLREVEGELRYEPLLVATASALDAQDALPARMGASMAKEGWRVTHGLACLQKGECMLR